jgi:pimeloyl-ACP methyl ester carboxylesterase
MTHPPASPPCLFIAALLLSGCACAPTCAAVPCPCDLPHALVLVADGAGNFRAASANLRRVVGEADAPLCVEPFVWSHGYCRILADQVGVGHMRDEAKRLAATVLAQRERDSATPVYLVGHSAGCGVVLAAAESLPLDSVERIVLLAPAVSAYHDLKPALAASRRGVDVFYSKADWWYLGMGVTMVGTADRHWDPAAGRVGFKPPECRPEDVPLYAKLRQYPWQADLSWTGHKGGHYGAYQPGFLKACVLPLLDAAGDAEK